MPIYSKKRILVYWNIKQKGMNTCMDALRAEHINKVSLVAFADNEIGNQFWHQEGWRLRSEVNCYEFNLNEENRISINE